MSSTSEQMNALLRRRGRPLPTPAQDSAVPPKRHPTADAGEGRRPENRVDAAPDRSQEMNEALRAARRG